MALAMSVLCSQYLCAQPRVMGIDELFLLADENSRSIQSYRTGVDAAAEALKAAKAQRLPDIKGMASVSYLGDGHIWDRHYKNGMKVDMPHFGNNFALEVQQVLYAGGAISSGIELAELGKQMAQLDSEKNRQEIRFLLVGYYLDLYKLSNQMQVLQKNIQLTDRVIGDMRSRHKQGTVLKNDITRYELQKEQLQLQYTRIEDAYKIMNHQLVTTLHLPAWSEIAPDTTMLSQQVLPLAEADWQQLAKQSHIGLKQAETSVLMGKQKLKLERSERLPKIALVAADHLDGPITIEVPVLDNNFNYWYVGVGISYNFSSLFKNNRKIKQSKLELRRVEQEHLLAQEHVENAVQASYTNFLTSFTDLRTQEKSVQLALQNYGVVDNRYKNDLALLTDMLDASNIKLGAELDLVNARVNVVYNYLKMKYITHTL